MFTNIISRPERFPESLAESVCIENDGLDDSLLMTMTVLLYNRVEKLKIAYRTYGKRETEYSFNTDPDVYAIYWIETNNPEEIIRNNKNSFTKIEKLPVHEKFFSEQLKQKVTIRYMPNENTACVFLDTLTLSAWHAIPFILSKMFPVFKEKPLTKDEKSFLETLSYKTPKTYIEKLAEILNTQEFKNYILGEQIVAFEKSLFKRKVEAAKESLTTLEYEMQAALEKYRAACTKHINAMALVNGLVSMEDQIDEHTELQNYLVSNKRICNVILNGSYISFIVKTFLAPHHIEEWETMSQRGSMFNKYQLAHGTFADPKNIKTLLDGILSEDRCLKLKMCAYFKMDYFGSSVESARRYNFVGEDKELKEYIPNPHLDMHNCFGQNKLVILEQLRTGDAIGAIECAIACTQRVNIHEYMSFDPFVSNILQCTEKCLVADDGTELTPEEAVEYLKGKNND